MERRRNCCNCGAPLGDGLRCIYCGTVAPLDADGEPVILYADGVPIDVEWTEDAWTMLRDANDRARREAGMGT